MLVNTIQGQELMEQCRQRRDELEHFMHQMMEPNVDYMVLENNKLCLLKAGAEKICDFYGYAIRYELVQSSSSNVAEYAMYVVKAILTDIQSALFVAEGLGLASSQETQYAESNSMDVANTILKLAKKRALVDAVLSAVKGSFLFTQDMEEKKAMPLAHQHQQQQAKPASYGIQSYGNNRSSNTKQYSNNSRSNKGNSNSQSYNSPNKKSGGKTIGATENQLNYIEKLMSKRKISVQQICSELEQRYGFVDYHRLDIQQASEFIQDLKDMQPWAS